MRHRISALLVFTVCAIPAWAVGPRVARDAAPRGRVVDRGLAPRSESALIAAALRGTDGETHRVIVKFRDKARARVRDGTLLLAEGEVAGLAAIAERHAIRFEPLIKLSENRLRNLETRAAARSGRAQPDLAGIMMANIPDRGAAPALNVARALQAHPLVEYVEIEVVSRPPPPPGDYPPVTPDLTTSQVYFGPDPGMDIAYAWSNGCRGAGIRVSDCEYGYNTNHEDLVDSGITPEPGQSVHPNVYSNGWDRHGTAVLGELAAGDNGYGMTGMVPDADVYFFPEWTVERGFNRPTTVANAIAGSVLGDVVLLESQTIGAGGNFAPAEYSLSVWNVVKTGTDAGVIIVAAAGNGNQDLDSAPYGNYMARGDSGAIIVGSGTADTAHDKRSSSTYGSRVNVQGWGTSVDTLGYGTLATYGGDVDQRYACCFSGTSSASGFVTAACAALQSYWVKTYGYRLGPRAMRELLVATGLAQGSGGHVGPYPDVKAAMQAQDTDGDQLPDWWEWLYRPSLTNMNASSDSDGDGTPDGDEWIAMTSPTDPDDYPAVSAIDPQGTGTIISWPSRSNRVYGLWWGSNTLSALINIVSNLAATPPLNVYTDAVHALDRLGIYRTDVQIPPP